MALRINSQIRAIQKAKRIGGNFGVEIAIVSRAVLDVNNNIAIDPDHMDTTLANLLASKAGVLAVTGGLTSSAPTGVGIGYATGAGGAVTQATNRTTGVTLSKLSGQITTHNASLAAEVAAAFIVTNTTVAIGDTVVLSIQSGSNGGNTMVQVTTVTNGTFTIQVCNNNAAGGTAETGAIIINYAIIKSVAA